MTASSIENTVPHSARLQLGQHVEVLQRSKELHGSWQPAIICFVKNGYREVEYMHLLQSDGIHKVKESFSVIMESSNQGLSWRQKVGGKVRGFLRPCPPELQKKDLTEWRRGLFVDTLLDGAWWEGALVENVADDGESACAKVVYPDRGKEICIVPVKNLRISQEWDEVTGHWTVRGHWMHLSSTGEGKLTSLAETRSYNQSGRKHAYFNVEGNVISLAKTQNSDQECITQRSRKHGRDASAEPYNAIKKSRLAAKDFLLRAGWTLQFHQRLGRPREQVYISPTGRRFYSLTTACRDWKRKANKSCQKRDSLLSTYNFGEGISCLNLLHGGEEVSCMNGRGKVIWKHPLVKKPLEASSPASVISKSFSATQISSSPIHVSDRAFDDEALTSQKSYFERTQKNTLLTIGQPLDPVLSLQFESSSKDAMHAEETSEYDDICSACGDGGELLLCDQCPTAYHAECVGLKDIPEGNWYCFSCCCESCQACLFECGGDAPAVSCSQCEKTYHVQCSSLQGRHGEHGLIEGHWFCSKSCEEIYTGLQQLIGVSQPLEGGLSWMLLRCASMSSWNASECGRKLYSAQAVLQECFIPMIDHRTGLNLLSQILFSQGSKVTRLNCHGFYTLILLDGAEVISVATLRVHGSKLAEMPLIGTRLLHRRQGMCRCLMNVIEKLLENLGITKLILPAVPQLLKTWRGKFNFGYLNNTERSETMQMNLMRFPGTTLLKKFVVSFEKDHNQRSKKHASKHVQNMTLQNNTSLNLAVTNQAMEGNTNGLLSRRSSMQADFKRHNSSRDGAAINRSLNDTKVVVATTRSQRLVRSSQWVADALKQLVKNSRDRPELKQSVSYGLHKRLFKKSRDVLTGENKSLEFIGVGVPSVCPDIIKARLQANTWLDESEGALPMVSQDQKNMANDAIVQAELHFPICLKVYTRRRKRNQQVVDMRVTV